MPNEGDGNDPGQREQGTEAGKTRDAMDEANVGKGTAVPTCKVDGNPGSSDVSHGSRASSMIGRGNEHQNDTSGQCERSVLTLELYIKSTGWTSQQPWIPWTWPTRTNLQPPTLPIKWCLSDGSM